MIINSYKQDNGLLEGTIYDSDLGFYQIGLNLMREEAELFDMFTLYDIQNLNVIDESSVITSNRNTIMKIIDKIITIVSNFIREFRILFNKSIAKSKLLILQKLNQIESNRNKIKDNNGDHMVNVKYMNDTDLQKLDTVHNHLYTILSDFGAYIHNNVIFNQGNTNISLDELNRDEEHRQNEIKNIIGYDNMSDIVSEFVKERQFKLPSEINELKALSEKHVKHTIQFGNYFDRIEKEFKYYRNDLNELRNKNDIDINSLNVIFMKMNRNLNFAHIVEGGIMKSISSCTESQIDAINRAYL